MLELRYQWKTTIPIFTVGAELVNSKFSFCFRCLYTVCNLHTFRCWQRPRLIVTMTSDQTATFGQFVACVCLPIFVCTCHMCVRYSWKFSSYFENHTLLSTYGQWTMDIGQRVLLNMPMLNSINYSNVLGPLHVCLCIRHNIMCSTPTMLSVVIISQWPLCGRTRI